MIEHFVLESIIPVSKAEICENIKETSPRTVEVVLASLQKSGKIKKIGNTKSAKYVNSKYVS